jgi:DNA-binding transcriptional ArsR family regulator
MYLDEYERSGVVEVYLNKDVGKVYDLFSSLFITLNYDYYLKELEKYYMVEDKKFKNKIEDVRQAIEPNIEKYKCFFKPNPSLFSPFVSLHKMWQCKSIDSYMKYMKTLEEKEIKKELIFQMECFGEPWKEVKDPKKIDELIEDENKFINFLNKQDFSNEDKWNVLYYIKNIDIYKEDFISLIENYKANFELIFQKYQKEIDEFSCYLEKEIDEKGIDMEIPIYKYVDTDTIKTIYLVPSLFNEYSISQTVIQSKKESYIVLGKSIDKVLFNKYRDNALDRNILVLKNLGDQSRYQFLKLLSEGEKYGQEIADNLGITSATINYHSNNLICANLINVDRRENKTYFSLNKDTLREMIRFIEKDFGL